MFPGLSLGLSGPLLVSLGLVGARGQTWVGRISCEFSKSMKEEGPTTGYGFFLSLLVLSGVRQQVMGVQRQRSGVLWSPTEGPTTGQGFFGLRQQVMGFPETHDL